jgi:hypothetical protein
MNARQNWLASPHQCVRPNRCATLESATLAQWGAFGNTNLFQWDHLRNLHHVGFFRLVLSNPLGTILSRSDDFGEFRSSSVTSGTNPSNICLSAYRFLNLAQALTISVAE